MLHVLKFGGTSVAHSGRIKNAVSIIKKRLNEAKVAVVVSALGGVTDELLALMDLACAGDAHFSPRFEHLKKRHHDAVLDVASGDTLPVVMGELRELFGALEEDLHYVRRHKLIGAERRDRVLSYGERLSARIFASALNSDGIPAKAYESQHFVRTNNSFGDADVDSKTTMELVRKMLNPMNGTVPVITGFIGATAEQQITTLGRSGSDYTAGLMGEALGAQIVEIWTDVNGVLTADPNIAGTAVTIPRLHYREIAEMAHFGTKVLHPRTVLPLEELNIPISIRNSFDPDAEGTLITREYSKTNGTLKSVSIKKDIVLIALKSKGLDRIGGLLTRAMEALSRSSIQVLFNAAASAEYGITIALNSHQVSEAKETLLEAFAAEFDKGLIEDPIIVDQVSLVTVIGDRLVHDLGLSGSVLSVLGENAIAPLAISRGVSNRHLSLVLKNDVSLTAVRLLNDHFCVHAQQVRLFVAGVGTIGSELLKQLNGIANDEYDIKIIGACNSRHVTWAPGGIQPDTVQRALKSGGITDWGAIVDHLISDFAYRTVFVDATGSAEVARFYGKLLKAGIHIATPSKRANTMEQTYFDELMGYTSGTRTHYLYETTAGAGLPIFQTLKDLMRSGDRVRKLTGVLSGTMTYLFEALSEGRSFGDTVIKARELGYAEPDPRDDLSGEDVARKFLSLARTTGMRIERRELKVENLTPKALQDVSVAEFTERLHEYDAEWKARVEQALADNKVLRYVGTFENGTITVGVEAVSRSSPLGSLRGTDNQIAIFTDRYNTSPLVIQGPGAGREVTAAGLLADIQKIAIRIVR